MRLAIDARESGTSTGRYIDSLVANLHNLKPDFEIIILTKSGRLDYMRQAAPNFKALASDYEEFGFSEQLGFLKQLSGLKADLVHFGMTHQPVLYTKKSVTTIHDLTTARFHNPSKNWLAFKTKQLVYRGVIYWVAHKSAAILTPSNYVKDDLAKFSRVDSRKIYVTYEAAGNINEAPVAVEGVKAGEFIMYVGRPTPHKNLQRLIEAFIKLGAANPSLQLVLAGKKDPLYERFEKQITARGLKNIVFTGLVSEGQLRWLYENTAAYVFPSLSEGFGLPGLEAMAHGAPVVSSNATCLPEIYGQAAKYFNPMDVGDMATKIQSVLSNEGLRKTLIENGHKQAAKYSWQQTATQTLEVYKKLIT